MAATMLVGAQSGHPWQAMPQPQIQPPTMVSSPPPQFHNASNSPGGYFVAGIVKPRNDVDLDRAKLINVLDHFSQRLVVPFNNRPFRLVVHGGACMLLHPMVYQLSLDQHHYLPQLPHRTKTRDVDYIHRSFITEMAQLGVPDAATKLKECILSTARDMNLGADWMNSDADIALPMATAPNGITYDPIYSAAVQPNNIDLHTIYRSPNGMLTLISVTPFWAVSLKLVRYSPQDAADISLLLRNGTKLSQTNWTVETIRSWLFSNCWPMGYSSYDGARLAKFNERLEHAIQMIESWMEKEKASPKINDDYSKIWSSVNVARTPVGTQQITPLAAMGGGEVLGGEHGQGWKVSWPQPRHGGPLYDPTARAQSPPHGMSDQEDFWDPSDYSVAHPHESAATRKAKKKAAKARKSLSGPVQMPTPPPIYQFTPPTNMLSRSSSPWLHQPGQPVDHRPHGLSSLRDLDQSLGQLLASTQPSQPVPQVSHPSQPIVRPYAYPTMPGMSQPGPAWKRPEKPKKSKDKRKKGKDRERQKERERERLNKWTAPHDRLSHPVEDDDTDSSDSSGEETEDDEFAQGLDTQYQTHMGPSQPQPQPYPGPWSLYGAPQAHSHPTSHDAHPPPMHQPSNAKARSKPSSRDLSPTPRPVGLPPPVAPGQSQFISTYPGMQVPRAHPVPPTNAMPMPSLQAPPAPVKKSKSGGSFYEAPNMPRDSKDEDAFIPPEDGDTQAQQRHAYPQPLPPAHNVYPPPYYQNQYQQSSSSQHQARAPLQVSQSFQHQLPPHVNHQQQSQHQPLRSTSTLGSIPPNNSFGLY